MKISRNWLNNYIFSKKSDRELVDSFTQLGLECTSEYRNFEFSNIVIGKVEKCSKFRDCNWWWNNIARI